MKFTLIAKIIASMALVSALGTVQAAGAAPPSHVYVHTNETDNRIIHYARSADGSLLEIERVATGGKGNNGFKLITGEKSAPDSLVSMGSLAMTPDHRLLFTVNAGDSSVSSLAIGEDGKLKVRDHQPTGEKQVPTSLAYNARTQTLFVMHATGPNYIRSFKVKADGKLVSTGQHYTVDTPKFKRRFATQIVSSPDDRFVLVNIIYNDFPKPVNGFPKGVVSANDGTKDGLMVFPVNADGSLGEVVVNDAGGKTPFGLLFLRGSNDTFVNTFSEPGNAILSRLAPDGKVTSSPPAFVKLAPKTHPDGAADSCWLSFSPDNRYAYVANLASSDLTVFEIGDGKLTNVANSVGYVEGTYKLPSGKLTGGPVDSWGSTDGYLYQVYSSASQLVAYKMDGPQLQKIAAYPIPLNSAMGVTGF